MPLAPRETGIANVTLWQVLRKHLHLKAYKLSIIQHLTDADKVVRKLKLKLMYDRLSVGQSILVSGAHLRPVTNFSLFSKFPSDSCMFVIL
jgi:hypothetical protein